MENSKIECRIGTPIPEQVQKFYRLPVLNEDELLCLKETLDSQQVRLIRKSKLVIHRMLEVCSAPADTKTCAMKLSTYIEDISAISELRMLLDRSLQEITEAEAAEDA